jgi:hypothetical protein
MNFHRDLWRVFRALADGVPAAAECVDGAARAPARALPGPAIALRGAAVVMPRARIPPLTAGRCWQVLIKVVASSVNPADIPHGASYTGTVADPRSITLGADVAGTVVYTNGLNCSSHAKPLVIGDRVWGDIGAYGTVRVGGERTKELGAYAEYAVALDSQLSRAPTLLDLTEACAHGLAMQLQRNALGALGFVGPCLAV